MATRDGEKKEEIEKRLRQSIERLFLPTAVQTSSSSSRPGGSTGEVSPFQLNGSVDVVEEAPSSTPSCTSWSRDDMFNRLRTFKTMDWFGKPECAGPIPCARRGWQLKSENLIGCEFCKSYLSFVASVIWPKHEVDKAAREFAEKLSSGHKPHCPWRNSICPEEFAHFPPSTASSLVQDYSLRLSSMKVLDALPKLTSTAVQTVRCSKAPQLEFLLPPILDESRIERLEGPEKDSVKQLYQSYESYQQALKLISLCGWELRVLPYVLECESGSRWPKLTKKPLSTKDVDPASAVLDCKLCGRSVGVWNLETVRRPNAGLSELLARIAAAEKKAEPTVVEPTVQVAKSVDTPAASPVATAASPDASQEDELAAASKLKLTVAGSPASQLKLTVAGGPRPARTFSICPVYIPIPGLLLHDLVEPDAEQEQATFSGQNTINNKRERERTDEEDAQARRGKLPKNAATTLLSRELVEPEAEQEQPNFSGRNAVKRRRTDDEDTQARGGKLLKDAETIRCSSSVEGVAITQQTRNENSAESVDCTGDFAALAQPDCSLSSGNRSKEFDPFRDHHYFCPWITANGGDCCGWQATLDALYASRTGPDDSAAAATAAATSTWKETTQAQLDILKSL